MTEPTKVTLYADDTPYQVLDLKDIDDMSEEEYNDKLKDAWLKKTHYETIEELTMAKYYNYEVEEEKPREKTDWREVALVIFTYVVVIGLIGLIIFSVFKICNGG